MHKTTRLSQKNRSAFTLIELLIVVAIIAILAAIAVPNFLEAQVRSKVSRVKADMRTIILALEMYFVEWNAYAQKRDFTYPTPPINQQTPWWQPLTTPVAYMTLLPRDPFGISTPFGINPWTGGFLHLEPFRNTWAGPGGVLTTVGWGPYPEFVPEMIARGYWYELFSVGPDGIQGSGVPAGQVKNKGTAMGTFYDPTNGTVSNGDIVRFGPGTSDHIAF